MAIESFASAKVNLSLHVTGQRNDGYHLLDSLVVFANIGDRLSFDSAPTLSIETSGPFAQGVPVDAGNLVWRAAELAGWTGRIRLEKNLPHGAGIGGGSADAAAVLRQFGGAARAAELGADVPVCLNNAPQRMRGIGDQLDPVRGLPQFELLLVNPHIEVPTGAVFAGLREKTNAPMERILPQFDNLATLCRWLARQRNDLEAPARTIAPQIDDVLAAMDDALLARMSGSGATCFGIYENAAHAEARIRTARPDWWVMRGRCLN
ncbi:4-(cytidine 5'-diphospho)-2-C-methyl-D-erythritol kinase [uncultured Sulfitobacter sp.]|uniref:4-(cytidine 5'-diphospho)-2-C-methyl-D-erythritol kinase n=1 Tax=uncultured Sulfitobacter sp. TaxID=191468 RepID=UPI002618130A|nr:4-(cytidine 5'-diphospho)-2-C-methyl-D-erythritol kinase [uncultured Sulfitobacter sp.]